MQQQALRFVVLVLLVLIFNAATAFVPFYPALGGPHALIPHRLCGTTSRSPPLHPLQSGAATPSSFPPPQTPSSEPLLPYPRSVSFTIFFKNDGDDGGSFLTSLPLIVSAVAGEPPSSVSPSRSSAGGAYSSVTVSFHSNTQEMHEKVYRSLRADERVKLIM